MLILTGDDLDNRVAIKASPSAGDLNDSAVTITGLANTQIDDGDVAKTFTGVQSLKVVLGDGNDRVESDAEFFLVGALNFDLGDGDNTLNLMPSVGRLFGGKLSVKAGDGSDTINIHGVGADPSQQGFNGMTFKLGDGNASIDLQTFSNFGKVQMSAGDGDDTVQLVNIELIVPGTGERPAAPLSINMGAGNADVHLSGATRVGPTTIAAGNVFLSATDVSMGPTSIVADKHGDASASFDGTSEVTGNLSLKGNAVLLEASNDLTVDGKVSLMATKDAEFTSSASVDIAKSLTVQSTAGAARFLAAGDDVAVGGNWIVNGGQSVDVDWQTSNPEHDQRTRCP